MTALSVLYFLSNWVSLILYFGFDYSSLFQLNCHVILEFVFLTFFYVNLITNEKKKKWVLYFFYLISFLTFFSWFLIGFNNEITFLNIFSKVIIISISFFFKWKLIERVNHKSIFQIEYFWINSTVLFYSVISLIIFLFEEQIVYTNQSAFYYLWPINQINTIVYYLFFSISLWKMMRR